VTFLPRSQGRRIVTVASSKSSAGSRRSAGLAQLTLPEKGDVYDRARPASQGRQGWRFWAATHGKKATNARRRNRGVVRAVDFASACRGACSAQLSDARVQRQPRMQSSSVHLFEASNTTLANIKVCKGVVMQLGYHIGLGRYGPPTWPRCLAPRHDHQCGGLPTRRPRRSRADSGQGVALAEIAGSREEAGDAAGRLADGSGCGRGHEHQGRSRHPQRGRTSSSDRRQFGHYVDDMPARARARREGIHYVDVGTSGGLSWGRGAPIA